MRQFWADSRGKVIVILLILWIAALIHEFRLVSVGQPVVALVSCVMFDWFFSYLRVRRSIFSLSSVITGFLIGLILDPSGGLAAILAAGLVACMSKQWIGRGGHKHIFNPAAFGITVSSFLFRLPVGWWAAAWGIIPVVIIGIGMTPVLWKLRRLWMPLTFLSVYFTSMVLFAGSESAVRLTLDGTVFMFSFIMLAEPITSMGKGIWRYIWGGLVGVLVALETLVGFSWGDPFLNALLGANVIGFLSQYNKIR